MTEGTKKQQPAAAASFRVSSAGKTHTGRVRDHNEDRMQLHPNIGVFLMADGMGGHNAGEIASTLTTLSVENFFTSTSKDDIPKHLDPGEEGHTPVERRMIAAVRKANADVHEIGKSHRQHKGMGCTLVAAHVDLAEGTICIAHVGDSRCYRIRGGEMKQLTDDHSLIGDAKKWKPDITEAELAMLPKNMITRAVGRQPEVEVDIRTETLEPKDLYLICSDGLSGMVDDARIMELATGAKTLEAACDQLIDAANDAGGEDNVTVVLISVEAIG